MCYKCHAISSGGHIPSGFDWMIYRYNINGYFQPQLSTSRFCTKTKRRMLSCCWSFQIWFEGWAGYLTPLSPLNQCTRFLNPWCGQSWQIWDSGHSCSIKSGNLVSHTSSGYGSAQKAIKWYIICTNNSPEHGSCDEDDGELPQQAPQQAPQQECTIEGRKQ